MFGRMAAPSFYCCCSFWLLVTFLWCLSEADNSNKVWILLNDARVDKCQNVDNKFEIAEKDVIVTNQLGRQVHYLEAPGTYTLNFKRIIVEEVLPHLTGQTNCVLQVPLVSVGKTYSWDLPYQLVPERTVWNGYKCDKQSGPVEEDGKPFCRYCDVCATTTKAEQLLTKGHKYLPKVGSSSEPGFEQTCDQISAKEYSITRTINLPDRQKLEDEANKQLTGVGGELKKKLNKGKGKLQTLMILTSSDKEPLDRDSVYSSSQSCRCCQTGVNDLACKLNPFGACNQERCNGEYAQRCVQGQARKVGCFSVQFNYQLTDNPQEVKTFLSDNHYQDEYNDFGGGNNPAAAGQADNKTSSSNSGGGSSNNNQQNKKNQGQDQGHNQQPPKQPSGNDNNHQQSQGGGGGNQGSSSDSNNKDRECEDKVQPRIKEICKGRWSQKPCCSMCGRCQ